MGDAGYGDEERLYEWSESDSREYARLQRKRAFWDVMAQLDGASARPTHGELEKILDVYVKKMEGQFYRDAEWWDCGDAIGEVMGDDWN